MSSLSDQSAGRGRLPVAPRDKRPALAALAVLLILVGALGSALLVFRSGDRVNVLAARENITFGQRMTAADFSTVRVAAGEDAVIDSKFVDNFTNSLATSAIPAGTILNPRMFTKDRRQLIPEGAENVGVVIDATQRPSTVPKPGDVVRVYYVAGSGGSKVQPADPVLVDAARVMSVGRGAGAGTRSITLLVRTALAATVADYASAGNIALTLLPGGTKPSVDYAQ